MSTGLDTGQVVFESGLARTLLAFLAIAQREERGGVLLGFRLDGKVVVTTAVFPPQLMSAPDRCAFDVNAIEVIRAAASVDEPRLLRSTEKILGWVHTHPRIGLYLSQTDVTTLAMWAQLDPATIAVVVDPFAGSRERDRIAWWTGRPADTPPSGGPRVTGGQPVAPGRLRKGALTAADTAMLAAAIKSEASGGIWEVVTAECATTVFPRPSAPAESS